MKYKYLGDTGIQVSSIGLGSWINFDKDKGREDLNEKIVTEAYNLGINYFDVADTYGKGFAEEQLGYALSKYKRSTMVISTKVFFPMSDDVNDRGLSRKHILESIEQSLKRLQMDYIDIYLCHRPDPNTSLRETAMAMNYLVNQGLIHYWGTSEWSAAQIIEISNICNRYGWALPKVEQPQYSLLWKGRVETEILPCTLSKGIGLVTWSPLAMGMLTGKYDNGIPTDSRFNNEKWAKARFVNSKNQEKVKKLKNIADEINITRSQLALAWCLRHKNVSSVITGATTREQIIENVKATDVKLTEETLTKINNIMHSRS